MGLSDPKIPKPSLENPSLCCLINLRDCGAGHLCHVHLYPLRHGRAVSAIRGGRKNRGRAAGINTTYYKLFAFVLAAFIAGVAAAEVFAHQIGIIDPSKLDFGRSVEVPIMVVLAAWA